MFKFQRDLLAISRRLAQRRIKIQESDRPRGKSRGLRVCVISNDEAIALMRKGILPCCTKHTHQPFLKAVKMVADDLACTIGEEFGLAAIIEHSSNGYVWKTRKSDGVSVRQMRRVVQG
jgi:hypothetical protein